MHSLSLLLSAASSVELISVYALRSFHFTTIRCWCSLISPSRLLTFDVSSSFSFYTSLLLRMNNKKCIDCILLRSCRVLFINHLSIVNRYALLKGIEILFQCLEWYEQYQTYISFWSNLIILLVQHLLGIKRGNRGDDLFCQCRNLLHITNYAQQYLAHFVLALLLGRRSGRRSSPFLQSCYFRLSLCLCVLGQTKSTYKLVPQLLRRRVEILKIGSTFLLRDNEPPKSPHSL